jgi:hypothetical protein
MNYNHKTPFLDSSPEEIMGFIKINICILMKEITLHIDNELIRFEKEIKEIKEKHE